MLYMFKLGIQITTHVPLGFCPAEEFGLYSDHSKPEEPGMM